MEVSRVTLLETINMLFNKGLEKKKKTGSDLECSYQYENN